MMNLFNTVEFTDEEEELLDRIHEQTPLDPAPTEEPAAEEQPSESDSNADEQ